MYSFKRSFAMFLICGLLVSGCRVMAEDGPPDPDTRAPDYVPPQPPPPPPPPTENDK